MTTDTPKRPKTPNDQRELDRARAHLDDLGADTAPEQPAETVADLTPEQRAARLAERANNRRLGRP